MIAMDQLWADMDSMLAEINPPKPVTIEPTNNPYMCVCGAEKSFYEHMPVCTSCGRTDSHNIDDGPEWSSGVNEDGTVNDPGRCGMASDTELFSSNWGRGTIISTRGATYSQKKMARINFHSSMNHKDRALYHAYDDIERASGPGGLNLLQGVVRQAKVLYRKFNGEKLTRGAIRVGIKANCVLYACKLNKVPRTTREVADAFGIPTKDISRTTEMFRDVILGDTETKAPSKSSFTKPIDVVVRLMNAFTFHNQREVRMSCNRLATKLEKCVPLMSKTPTSIAAVIILKSADGITKNDIIEKCEISLPTLNKIEAIVDKYLESIAE